MSVYYFGPGFDYWVYLAGADRAALNVKLGGFPPETWSRINAYKIENLDIQ
jgi:hypothetical protein